MAFDFQPLDFRALDAKRRANERLCCFKRDCNNKRTGFARYCVDHYQHAQAVRNEAAKKAVATRRARNPNWGKPSDVERYERWRSRAQNAVAYAVENGALPSLASGEYACTDCSDVAYEYDHRDYARPLDVEPVCRRCNILRGSAEWPHPGRFQFAKLGDAPTRKPRKRVA